MSVKDYLRKIAREEAYRVSIQFESLRNTKVESCDSVVTIKEINNTNGTCKVLLPDGSIKENVQIGSYRPLGPGSTAIMIGGVIIG